MHAHDPISILDPIALFVLIVFGWFLVYKSPLALVWFRLLAPVLEPLGFRLVVMDRRFGIHAVRYKREWRRVG